MEPDNFHHDLRKALRREAPSPDFAARVLARAAASTPPVAATPAKVVVLPLWRKPAAWAIAAGITLAALIPAGFAEHERRQEAKRAEAGRQLALALDITRIQLQKTKARLQKVSKQRAL